MRTILCFALLLLAIIASANPPLPIVTKTGKISLQWTASPTPSVTYRLYHSTNNTTWDKTYPGIATTTYTVTNVPAGSLNWFAVTAVNFDGIESDPSNVVEKPIEQKPAPATGLMSVPVIVTIESQLNDEPFLPFRSYTNNILATADEGQRTFRAHVEIGRPVELVKPQ